MKREATVFTCDICGERETVGPHETPRTIEFQIDWAEKCQDKDPWQTKHICADCLKEANACVPNSVLDRSHPSNTVTERQDQTTARSGGERNER